MSSSSYIFDTLRPTDFFDKKFLLNRKVGRETSVSFQEKLESGFWQKYMSGIGIDVGGKGSDANVLPVLPGAVIVDLDFPEYDGLHIPAKDCFFDYVYSSHCLEHIKDYKTALRDWYRVTKIGGFIVITVPHKYTYEKKEYLPSRWNGDHKRFYTPSSLLKEIEDSLMINEYRIELLKDNVTEEILPPDVHSKQPYEILLVIKKVKKQLWILDHHHYFYKLRRSCGKRISEIRKFFKK